MSMAPAMEATEGTNLPILDPFDILSKRSNKQAAYTVPVRPDRQQIFAEALYVLFTVNAESKRSDIVIDAIIDSAIRSLKEHPEYMLSLKKKLVALFPSVGNNRVAENSLNYEADDE